MKKCSKCGWVISDNDKMAWKCTECGKAFRVNLSKLKKLYALKNKPENSGKSLLKCSACGKGIDNGNEMIAFKCSACGNIMSGSLGDFTAVDNENPITENQIAGISTTHPNISNDFIKCLNCGNNVPKNAKFCPECGNPISNIKNHKKKKVKIAMICISISVCLISCAVFIISRLSNTPENTPSNIISDIVNKEDTSEKNFDNIILTQDTFELGSSVNLIDLLKYDSENIINVSIDDDCGFDSNTCGDYTVTFQFTDNEEHMKKIPFQTSVIDTTPPELSLSDTKCYVKKGQDFSLTDYVSATDKSGIKSIDYNGELNLSTAGKYVIQVTATDNNNNISDPKKFKIIVKDRENCDIRNAKFGDSQETVIQYEDLKNIDSRDNNELYYHTSIDNEDADLIYFFNDDNKLYQVAFVFTDTHTNYNYYLSSYFKMLENLSKKYGDPSVAKKNEGFTYSAYNDDAKALEMGVLGYDTYWKLNNMNIALVIKSDNNEIHFVLAYFSTKYHKATDQSAF